MTIIMLNERRKNPLFTLWELNASSLHLNKLESPSPKDALCQICLKLAQRFWRRRFFNLVNVFSLFGYYLPLEKGWALHLKKLESPSPKDPLFQVWLKLAQWFGRIISPWKRAGPWIEQILIPFTQGCIVLSLVEIDPVVLGEEDF